MSARLKGGQDGGAEVAAGSPASPSSAEIPSVAKESDAPESGERTPIDLQLEYKRLNTFFYDYTKNIAKGGTFIKTEKPLSVGTVFRFRLTLPQTENPVSLRGEVRWVVRPGEPPSPDVPATDEPGMGIRFVYASADERQQFERFVETLMVNSLGPLIYAKLLSQ